MLRKITAVALAATIAAAAAAPAQAAPRRANNDNATAGAISVDPRLTGAAAGWAGFTQMAFGAAASQLVGSLQDGWPFAVFWFMASASILALLTHTLAIRRK